MDYYNVKVVNDVIYNDTTHLVSVFKDYLIYDDISEFLKRHYSLNESITRLTKIYDFYDKYSKVFPNYIILEENKYMFKNIERKQIAIDERQQFFQELEEKEKADKAQAKNSNLSQLFEQDSDQLFDSKFLNSVARIKTHSDISDSFPFEVVSSVFDSHIQNCNLLGEKRNRSEKIEKVENKPKTIFKRLEDYNLPELVEKFLVKDSNLLDSSNHSSHDQKTVAKQPKATRISIEKIKSTQVQQNKKQNVFNYQELKTKYMNDMANIQRQEKPKAPVHQNYMMSGKINNNPNDLHANPNDQFRFDNNRIELKKKYNEIRKQKRPKSSDNQAIVPHKKTCSK